MGYAGDSDHPTQNVTLGVEEEKPALFSGYPPIHPFLLFSGVVLLQGAMEAMQHESECSRGLVQQRALLKSLQQQVSAMGASRKDRIQEAIQTLHECNKTLEQAKGT